MTWNKCKACYLLGFFFLCSININCLAQEYIALTIPDSLKKDAFAVIRNYNLSFVQNNKNQATLKVTKAVTILEKKGETYSNFSFSGDKFHELSSFSGIIRDAFGKEIKKIKKGDLVNSTINLDMNTLVTDGYDVYYECQSPSYPYTVEYYYEIKYKNGVISYPPFYPMGGFYISVEKADYTIELPLGEKLRSKSNFECPVLESASKDKQVYSMSVSNLKAIGYEPLSPSSNDLFPHTVMAPNDFCYDSQCGNMSTWKNYGLWANELLKGRDNLTPEFVVTLKDMIKNAKSDKEKVKILYEYLQKNTRYVSIQLGIGGFQPIDASTVHKTKFGDCKGLTNLMKSMLKAIDIPSNYCEIRSGGEKALYPDFANMFQTNHVILLVPFAQDSVWLECTSDDTPFGYVPSNIAGHDALIISDKGGKLCRLPNYNSKQNLMESKLTINIAEDGTTNGSVDITAHLKSFDEIQYYFRSNERDNKVAYLNSNLKFPSISYGDINMTEYPSSVPYATVSTVFDAKDFVNKTGSRYFIPICPLAKPNFSFLTSSTRSLDINLEAGYSELDSIIINIPPSYLPESLPKDINITTPFGTFSTTIKHEGNSIIYTEYIDIYSGKYPKEQYKDLKEFFSKISAAIKRKVTIKRQD